MTQTGQVYNYYHRFCIVTYRYTKYGDHVPKHVVCACTYNSDRNKSWVIFSTFKPFYVSFFSFMMVWKLYNFVNKCAHAFVVYLWAYTNLLCKLHPICFSLFCYNVIQSIKKRLYFKGIKLGHELIEMSVPSELNRAPYAFRLEKHVKAWRKLGGHV